MHLGLGATAVPQELFTGEPAWYERYAARNAADGVEGPGMGTENRPR